MQKTASFLIFFILQLGLWIGIALGLIALVWILYAEWFANPEVALSGMNTKIGEIWFFYHTPSLNLSQAIVQRYIHPSIWHALITPLLSQSIWLFCVLTLGGNLVGMTVMHFWRKR